MAEPLRAMVMGAPLEDARHLAQRYDRMRQEGEAQVLLLRVCVYFKNNLSLVLCGCLSPAVIEISLNLDRQLTLPENKQKLEKGLPILTWFLNLKRLNQNCKI